MLFDLHERRKLKRYLFSHITLAVLLILVVMLGWSVWGIAKKERETREKREELANERDVLIRRGEELGEAISGLKTAQGVEAELRQRFEVGAPGEKMIVIVDPEISSGETFTPKEKGFWGWIKGWFK